MQGHVFDIQKFCINDGPGIRTTVFLKGCPLNCAWCHNPESKSCKPEVFFDLSKCCGCRKCEEICTHEGHRFDEQTHLYRRDQCVVCGECIGYCFTGALEVAGYTTTVEHVLEEVMKDEAFYRNSGGGMTVSGGEPMMQFEFVRALLAAAKEQQLHVCMETSGFASTEHFMEIAPLVDLFLFDYKLTDSALHKQYTGVPNDLILKNLMALDAAGAKIVLRCPIIPTVNDTPDHFAGIVETANRLQNLQRIDIEPYHPLGSGKSQKLGKEYAFAHLTFPEKSQVDQWIAAIQQGVSVQVKKA